jgi:hypothetical protein
VRALAVLAETLAVISRNDDDRTAPPFGEPRQKPPDLDVHRRDLALVGVVTEALREWRRRLVSPVRVVVVNPKEERLPGRCDDRERTARGRRSASLSLPIEALVVNAESGVRAPGRVENRGGHDGGGPIAGGGETGRERGDVPVVLRGPVVAHSVGDRRAAGQNGKVGRQRDRGRRPGFGEPHA